MKKSLIMLAFFIFFISCADKKREFYQNSKLKKEYFLKKGKIDGKYLEYYKSGNLKEKHFYMLGSLIDTSYFFYDNKTNGIKIKIDRTNKTQDKAIFYYENQVKKAVGLVDKTNIKIGKWNFFRQDGSLKEVKEYFNIKNKEYTNQIWEYDINGKLDLNKGNFYKMEISGDTIKIDEEVKLLFNLKRPLFSSKSKFYAVLPVEQSNLKNDFSNFDKIERDTVLSLNNEGRSSEFDKYNLSLAFSTSFDSAGIKNIKGVLVERIEKGSLKENDSVQFKERYLYFEKKIYVKE